MEAALQAPQPDAQARPRGADRLASSRIRWFPIAEPCFATPTARRIGWSAPWAITDRKRQREEMLRLESRLRQAERFGR
jgi:hypothetical protein